MNQNRTGSLENRALTSTSRFADWPPLIKVAIWGAGTYGCGLAIQALLTAAGADFSVFSRRGAWLILTLAMLTVGILARMDRRPLSDYGLAVGPQWARQFRLGFLAGTGAYALYFGLLWYSGAAAPDPRGRPPFGWLSVLWIFPVSVVLATTQVVLFSGYVVGLFRRAWGKGLPATLAAVFLPALLFGLLSRVHAPWEMLWTQNQPQLAGLVFAIALLNVLRLTSGSVVLPAAVLAGFIFVVRSNKTLRLVRTPGDADLMALLAPGLEPLRSPVLWAILAAAVVAGLLVLWRRGEPEPDGRQDIPESFRRIYPLAMFNLGAPLDVWLARLFKARFRIPPVYLPRLAVALSVSCLNTLVCLPERFLLPLILRRCKVPDPVFIVGAHRSGTTHLHNLLALDPGLIPARTFQVLNPNGYMVCGWPLAVILAAFMPWKRPQDHMDLGILSPQEDEFAMLNSTGLSPYWAMSFPQHYGPYLETAYPDRLSPRDLEIWQRHYLRFLRKLTLFTSRRPVLKNPCNTTRIALLRRMFPGARFIHIYRNPCAVYRSNLHMKHHLYPLVQLQEHPDDRAYGRQFLEGYRDAMERLYRDSADCPPGRFAEVRYEDLKTDPMGEIRRIYRELELPWNGHFEERLRRYLAEIAGYRGNPSLPLPEDVQQSVEETMKPFLVRWGYLA